jgi:chemotaxis protein CheD
MDKTLYMAELGVVGPPDVLKTTVGSCVALVLHCPEKNLVGMAHIMLPSSEGHPKDSPGKFSNTALPALLEAMNISKLDSSRLVKAKIVGGANMFAHINKNADSMKIGIKNAESLRAVLHEWRIPLIAEDVGGNAGRSITLDAEHQRLIVRVLGQDSKEL